MVNRTSPVNGELVLNELGERSLLHLKTELVDGDLRVWAQSDLLEAFFSALSNGATEKIGGWKNRYFYVPWTKTLKIHGLAFSHGSMVPIQTVGGEGEKANAFFLAARGLKEGIEFTVPSSTFFTTVQSAKLFERLVESGMIDFYDRYLKKHQGDLSLTISRKM